MDEYKKVIGGKLRFKGSVLPVKEKTSKYLLFLYIMNRKKKSKKDKSTNQLEKIFIKPGEEKDYKPVVESEDTRTEAEKRFDERLSQRVNNFKRNKKQDKQLIEKRSKMTYQQIVDVKILFSMMSIGNE